DHDELGRFERRETHVDIDDAAVDVVLRGRFGITLDEVRFAWRASLEGALAEEAVHEGADVQTDLRPEGLIVGFEDDPLRAAVEGLLDHEGGAADGDVLPL